jgi:hypothetical protein
MPASFALAVRARTAACLHAFGRSVRSVARRVAPPDRTPPPTPAELHERWGRWLRRSYDDIVLLHGYQAQWDELVDVVDSNRHIPQPNHVMDFVRDLYGVTIAVGIRRQADKSDDVANLRRLINDVARHPYALTRSWFIDRYPDFLRDVGAIDFEKFARAGEETVDPEIIRKDLAELGTIGARVKRFVDQHLAHSADDPQATIPTYADLRSSLKGLDDLLRRYYLLIDGGGLVSSTPTMQYNFRLPLIVPWAPNDRFLQHLRRTDPQWRADDVEHTARDAVASGGVLTTEQVNALLAVLDALRAEVRRDGVGPSAGGPADEAR